jgi:hypothetical protein
LVLNETIDITQIPQIVNDALFGGGSDTLMAARLAVSIFILMMVMLPMILARIEVSTSLSRVRPTMAIKVPMPSKAAMMIVFKR